MSVIIWSEVDFDQQGRFFDSKFIRHLFIAKVITKYHYTLIFKNGSSIGTSSHRFEDNDHDELKRDNCYVFYIHPNGYTIRPVYNINTQKIINFPILKELYNE